RIECAVGAWNDCGQKRGLVGVQRCGRCVEVSASSGFGAVDAVSPFDHVQIDFQYSPLSQNPFHLFGDHRFVEFAKRILRSREKEILRELLRDCRRAPAEAAFVPILLERLLHFFPIEASVIEEPRVFAGKNGLSQVARDAIVRHPCLNPPRLFTTRSYFRRSLVHHRGCCGIRGLEPHDAKHNPSLIEDREADDCEKRDLYPAAPLRTLPSSRDGLSSSLSGLNHGGHYSFEAGRLLKTNCRRCVWKCHRASVATKTRRNEGSPRLSSCSFESS